MQIDVTILNEAELVARYRAALHKAARCLVADSPDRAGKHAAGVVLPIVDEFFVYVGNPDVKIQWT